ncbi:MAG: riboflavin synthase [Treponema sp.]|uniref:riboflavin synthase n=1 Tax=Treponema sp. TaxID=166 RepID=UPI00298E23EA|nr:riboflavin synthase [Treponema sp.]MBR5934426.1 riboflavin synthase [Treponema sp.]
MFTGIVEETGEITHIRRTGQSVRIGIRNNITFDDLKIGDSLCVNGICLTVTEKHNNKTVFADVTPETFSRTDFNTIMTGHKVNLERAMKACDRFGGHIVTGHIDGTARIKSLLKNGNSIEYRFICSEGILNGIVEKGSVAVNGISLTVAKMDSESFTVSVIPHTLQNTNLFLLKENDRVNIECDILGKYIKKYRDL